MTIQKTTLLGIIFSSLMILSANMYAAGTADVDSLQFDIKWIKSFSTAEDFNVQKSITTRLFDFLFGTSNQKLVRPTSLISLSNGIIYALDQGQHALVMINPNEGEIEQEKGYPSPIGICIGKEGEILFTDSKLEKAFRRLKNENEYHVLNDTIDLVRPTGIAFSKKDNRIWIVETGAHRISVFNNDAQLIKRIGKRGIAPGEFNFPTYLWIDDSECVYVVDTMNYRVQILNSEGEVISMFGQAGDATGYFARPKGIATDSFGHIYVVDGLFHTVQIFDRTGKFLNNFGSQGRSEGEFWMPGGIFIDKKNKIYIADSYNSRIQVFQLIKRN